MLWVDFRGRKAGQHRTALENTERDRTYPRVLMKPLVEPSAYREQMSPIWRKLDILSDIFPQLLGPPVRSKREREKKVYLYENKIQTRHANCPPQWAAAL